MTKKKSTERVQALRQRRLNQGLARLEIYAPVEHHEAIKKMAAKLVDKKSKVKQEKL